MALQVSIQYHGGNVTYNVIIEEEQIYRLCRQTEQNIPSGEYIPEKLIIRRKGKLWVSDQEDRRELVQALIIEISQFFPANYTAA